MMTLAAIVTVSAAGATLSTFLLLNGLCNVMIARAVSTRTRPRR